MKMKKVFMGILLGVGLLGFVSISMAQDLEYKPYSADVTMGSPNSGMPPTTSKWYITKDKKRMETTRQFRGHSRARISIIRNDKHVTWSLNPETNTYTEIYIDPDGQALTNDVNQAVGMRGQSLNSLGSRPMGQLVGTETIDGQLADRYDSGASSYYIHGTTVPLKMVVNTGQMQVVTEFKNIQIGEPSPDLFEIPEGYTKKGQTIDLEKQSETLHSMIEKAKQQH